MKKLAQWQNDAALEYLSQERATGELKDLTKFIRKEGLWGTNDTGLYLKDLNVRGVLYSAIPASDRGFIRAKFKVENPNHAIEFGVGLHYIEENIKYHPGAQRLPVGSIDDDEVGGVLRPARAIGNGTIDPANCGFYYYDSTYMVGRTAAAIGRTSRSPGPAGPRVSVNPAFAANTDLRAVLSTPMTASTTPTISPPDQSIRPTWPTWTCPVSSTTNAAG